MSKRILLATLSMSLLMLSGCGSSKPSRSGSSETPRKQQYSSTEIPEWFLNRPTSKDHYYGVGMATAQNPSMALMSARERAAADVGASINRKVENMFLDYMQEAGVGGDARALNFKENVLRTVVNVTVKGCKVLKSPKIKEDDQRSTYYVLVEYPLESAITETKNAARNEEALFNEFKARQGFEALDKAIDRLDTTSN